MICFVRNGLCTKWSLYEVTSMLLYEMEWSLYELIFIGLYTKWISILCQKYHLQKIWNSLPDDSLRQVRLKMAQLFSRKNIFQIFHMVFSKFFFLGGGEATIFHLKEGYGWNIIWTKLNFRTLGIFCGNCYWNCSYGSKEVYILFSVTTLSHPQTLHEKTWTHLYSKFSWN